MGYFITAVMTTIITGLVIGFLVWRFMRMRFEDEVDDLVDKRVKAKGMQFDELHEELIQARMCSWAFQYYLRAVAKVDSSAILYTMEMRYLDELKGRGTLDVVESPLYQQVRGPQDALHYVRLMQAERKQRRAR